MPDVVQMTVDAFWRSLQSLQRAAQEQAAALEANRQRLIVLYRDTVRENPDPADAAVAKRALDPRIHRNSELRVRYRDVVAKFNQAVTAARSVLERAGFEPTELSGMGVIPLAVPLIAVSALGVAWAIVTAIKAINDPESTAIRSLERTLRDPATTTQERDQAAQGIQDWLNRQQPRGAGDPLGLGNLIPVAALVAAIVLLPPLLGARGRRLGRAAA